MSHRPCLLHFAAVAAGTLAAGCSEPLTNISFEPLENTARIIVHTGSAVGDLRLWLPEAIASNQGFCSVYPRGRWERQRAAMIQQIDPAGAFGPGNFTIGAETVECAGIRVPRDEPVAWRAELRARANRIQFAITLRNHGTRTIQSAGAPVCVTFVNAAWWSPDHVYVRSGGRQMSLVEMGEQAGKAAGFEAYLLAGQHYDNRFYSEFWGFNPHRLDTPTIISVHEQAGLRVTLRAPRAIFLHCNRDNPCTDVMLAFGDLPPGREVTSRGEIAIER